MATALGERTDAPQHRTDRLRTVGDDRETASAVIRQVLRHVWPPLFRDVNQTRITADDVTTVGMVLARQAPCRPAVKAPYRCRATPGIRRPAPNRIERVASTCDAGCRRVSYAALLLDGALFYSAGWCRGVRLDCTIKVHAGHYTRLVQIVIFRSTLLRPGERADARIGT